MATLKACRAERYLLLRFEGMRRLFFVIRSRARLSRMYVRWSDEIVGLRVNQCLDVWRIGFFRIVACAAYVIMLRSWDQH